MSNILRCLPLPEDVRGQVWLAAMPGRFETLAAFLATAEQIGADRIACLAAPAEIAALSPEYARARLLGALPLVVHDHPIPDYGQPRDLALFAAFIAGLCAELEQGRRLIVHCAAGIGRTGMVAQHILMALGVQPISAREQVFRTGSHPETAAQRRFCRQPAVLFRHV